MSGHDLTLSDVYTARRRIESLAARIPMVESPALTMSHRTKLFLKLENLQPTGSFKIRGATNKILSLSREARERGVITISSGNHGRAFSYVANQLGIHAIVYLSHTVPENKREAIQSMGAEVVVAGHTYDEAVENAMAFQESRDLTMIYPFDDPLIIAGQATIGMEIMEDFPEVDTVIVPLSGGG